MDRQSMNLVFGILLLVVIAVWLGPPLAHGAMPGTRQLVFSAAMFLFAISRFIMFKSPNSAIINPMRMVALLTAVASVLVKG